ncbi:MAG: cytochrome c-type biogenesis protein CcmH [Limnochordales bacterium]|nr:hypothetical protein [Bacillota bacterium]
MARRGATWVASILFFVALGVWGYVTVQDTVSEGLRMGEPAPDATLMDLEGNLVRLSDFRGKPLILRFSSRTCSYCYDDFGYLEELQRQYGDALQVVAVEFGAPLSLVRDAVRGRNRSYPVLVDFRNEAVEAYRPAGLPQNYFINAQGRLLSRVMGELSELDFRAHVAQILREDGQAFASLEDEVRAIAEQVRCQECQGLSVWQSQAPSAWQMREEIAELLAAGYTRDEVIEELVNQYGVWILMAPPAEGRFLWVYLTPFLVIGLGGVVVYVVFSRRRQAPPAGEDGRAEAIDPDVEARVRERLREYL